MEVIELTISPEFEKLIPPLSSEEFEQLEKNILSEGIRDALVAWNGIVIDGHNRFKIAEKHGLGYDTVEKEFATEDEAKVWMIDNQKGRRNLTDGWKFELAIKKKEFLSSKGKEKQLKTLAQFNDTVSSENDKTDKHNTRQIIAESLGWSEGKVAMAEVARKEAPEEWEKVKAGEISINQAYQSTKTESKNVHVSNNSGENEWYTPGFVIERVHRLFSAIDLDPASSELANKTVNATNFYTESDNGLQKEWFGNVWLNPPYAQPLISQFSEAVLSKREQYNQLLLLVNNATETVWLQSVLNVAEAVCFVKSRIKFIDKEGNASGSPLQGQVIIYIGENTKEFIEIFGELGVCMKK